jgi:hypothetical protein
MGQVQSQTMQQIVNDVNNITTNVITSNINTTNGNCVGNQQISVNGPNCTCSLTVYGNTNIDITNKSSQTCQINATAVNQVSSDITSQVSQQVTDYITGNQDLQTAFGSAPAAQKQTFKSLQDIATYITTNFTTTNVNTCANNVLLNQGADVCICGNFYGNLTENILNNASQNALSQCLFTNITNIVSNSSDLLTLFDTMDASMKLKDSGFAAFIKAIGDAIAKIFATVWGTIIAIAVIGIIILTVILVLIFHRKKPKSTTYSYPPYQSVNATGYGMPVMYQPQLSYPTTPIPQYSRI